MNMEIDDDTGCRNFRSLCEKQECGFELASAETNLLLEHKKLCSACSAWQAQHERIEEFAQFLPQFDVSEGLTQKILSEMEKETLPAVQTPYLPLLIAASVSVILLFPFDSMQSIIGWTAGIAGLAALKTFMSVAEGKEQPV